MAQAINALLVGADGQTASSTTNPLPVSLATSTAAIGKVNFNAGAAALSSVAVDTTINANTTANLISGSGSLVINIYQVLLTNSTASGLTFRNGTTALTGAMTIGTGGQLMLNFNGEPWFTMTSGVGFNLSSTVTSQVSGRLYYTQQ